MAATVHGSFRAAGGKLLARVDAGVAKAALDIEREAKVRCPVDTGALRASIHARPVSVRHWRVEVSQSYAAYVEYGTSRMRAQPYLTPAVEQVRRRLPRTLL